MILKKIVPFEQQKVVLDGIKEFLKSDDRDCVLEGVAGTGKSTIAREVFMRKRAKVEEYYIPSNVVGICLSHKAKLNLMDSIPNSKTYAAAVDLVMEYDQHGIATFKPKYGSNYGINEMKKYKFIIVDECSQFSQEMIDTLHDACSPNARFIWMGDHHQLPPIITNGKINDIVDSPTFNFKTRFCLTEKIRQQEGDHIAELADFICERIDTDHSLEFMKDIKTKFCSDKGKGYAISTIDQAISSYVRNFRNGVINQHITSYRRNRVTDINNQVRLKLWGEDNVRNLYNVGEYIVMEDQYEIDGVPVAFNGQTFIIKQIEKVFVCDIDSYSIHVTDENGINIDLIVPSEKGRSAYWEELRRLKNIGIKLREWSDYRDFRSKFANIAYGYCVSLYKVQGATLTNCYVDYNDIIGVSMINNKRKLQALYVGITRPTTNLAIF